jgi:hypothetical protein
VGLLVSRLDPFPTDLPLPWRRSTEDKIIDHTGTRNQPPPAPNAAQTFSLNSPVTVHQCFDTKIFPFTYSSLGGLSEAMLYEEAVRDPQCDNTPLVLPWWGGGALGSEPTVFLPRFQVSEVLQQMR